MDASSSNFVTANDHVKPYKLRNIDNTITEATSGANEGTEDENSTSDEEDAGNSWNVPSSLSSGNMLQALDVLHSYVANSDVREATGANIYSFDLLNDVKKNKAQHGVTDFFKCA